MRTADFDYALPEDLIAQEPMEPRDSARLLVVRRDESSFAHQHVHELPTLLEPGDLLVANRSRVLPARIVGRLRGGGRAELLLLRKLAPARWEVLGRPARRLRVGDAVELGADLRLRVSAVGAEGVREIEVESERADPDAALLALGSVPLPPYIHGWLGDPERYQTVFADVEGSAAAPTAGLHFTPRLIDALAERGVGFETLVLHVGLDTFRPITVDDPRGHRMHSEWFAVPPLLRQQVEATRSSHKRVVAVGTTSVRALESWAQRGTEEGWTDMFIVPGHEFRSVDALLTNFHLPRSTLLMLVSAFAGLDLIRAAYAEAIRERYRFFSFGDAMLIL
jgi:S-adenosylmethionine:tRNA ribosyltransferase-isomerase